MHEYNDGCLTPIDSLGGGYRKRCTRTLQEHELPTVIGAVFDYAVEHDGDGMLLAHTAMCSTSSHALWAPAMGRATASPGVNVASASATAGPCHIGP